MFLVEEASHAIFYAGSHSLESYYEKYVDLH